MKQFFLSTFSLLLFLIASHASPIIYVNQVGFDTKAPKIAVVGLDAPVQRKTIFTLINSSTGQQVFTGVLSGPSTIDEWAPGKSFYNADFSSFQKGGKYKISVTLNGEQSLSPEFEIGENFLAKATVSSIVHYYNQQRANTPQELTADAKVQLFGSDKKIDLRGGWCDASGDVSKYFSHLAYANYMSPQQIPLVVWSMVSADEAIPKLLQSGNIKDSLEQEALYGADYMMRALSKDDYFYMIVFSYFNKNPDARRVVGLHANSVTTNEYQCAFREGGGMAIAALARISKWKKHGEFTSKEYLDAAKRAFNHLLINNTKYDDDGKENIIDDYCALMAATELWITTDNIAYRDEARKRAKNLTDRMTNAGYFRADAGNRPFWHASDAGLPIIALSRYLKKEKDTALRSTTLQTIKKALDYNIAVTGNVSNPFGYARQTFLYRDSIKNGFFIPHENETGWWWQGENARLGSLAAAAIVGAKLVYPKAKNPEAYEQLTAFASRQISWILGCNPYSMCFMYKYGEKNVPYMSSNFGHGSQKGGISNGITGKEGNADGSGIDFKIEDKGNEWRWTEQWIPHAAWFLQAVAAMTEE